MFVVNGVIHSDCRNCLIIARSFHCGPYCESAVSAGARITAWESQLQMSSPAFTHKVNESLKKHSAPIIMVIHLLPISTRMSQIALSSARLKGRVVTAESGALLGGSSCRQPHSMLTVRPRSIQMMAAKVFMKQNMNPGAYCSLQV